MSLVAYESSESEEEVDFDYKPPSDNNNFADKGLETALNNSDDNYEFGVSSRRDSFPSFKNLNLTSSNQENIHSLLKRKLPAPAPSNTNDKRIEIQEDDDEFLRKKPMQSQEKPPRPPAKITIPSLLNFSEQLNDKVSQKLIKTSSKTTQSAFSLLSLLPKPRTGDLNATRNVSGSSKAVSTPLNKAPTFFIPESVKNRSTGNKSARSNPTKLKRNHLSQTNSDDSDDEGDFFSLNKKDDLPEVSSNEINDMVAKRAAQIAEATLKFDETLNNPVNVTEQTKDYMTNNPGPSSKNLQFDQRAIHALVGSQAKKRKKIVDDVEIKELSSDEILPNRNEWLRSALASETTYQPKGVLVDEEPAAGTRKKHQITYLAHQAKANEAELQAMWAANRQNRRATANKYGF